MSITLKAARINADKKRSEVAKYLGVSERTIAAWELGESVPNAQNAKSLINFYGISFDDITW